MSTSYESLRAKYGAEAEQTPEKVVTEQTALEKLTAEALAAADAVEKAETPQLIVPEMAPPAAEPAGWAPVEEAAPAEVPEDEAPVCSPAEQTPPATDVPAPAADPAVLELLRKQNNALGELSRRLEAFELKLASMGGKVEQLQHMPAPQPNLTALTTKIDALCQAQARQEKANVDILRDSKNFQATVREQMQRELDSYRKQHSTTANASLLTEIANLYISSSQAIGYLSSEKERRNISEIVLEGLLEILEEQDVVVHTTPRGEKRSVKTCKTRKTIPTGDANLHGAVAESYAPSFTLGNQVLIKEAIDTYVFDPALAPAEAPAPQEPAPETAPVEAASAEPEQKNEAAPEIID